MHTQSAEPRRLIIVRLDSGDDILQSIRAAVQEHHIRHGLILSGVGSINRYHIHVVETPELPPRDLFIQGEGPFDILSLNGLILNGRVHAHITFANTEKAMGGHLEEGCRILTFGVVVLAKTAGAVLTDWDRVGRL
ncbi:MAG: DNA-binding protein [Anaerolineae bacterium]|nr:DNA-binding protein [Anaerolineae bacterium]MDW8098799.1 DNA-binding protein [Anaerolineae bacterium]